MTYGAQIDKVIPGFHIYVREAEGIIDFQFGQAFDKSVTPQYDCGPYTATITKDGVTVATIPVPHHFWTSGWWYETTLVNTVIKTPADLIANGFVPPIGDTGLPTGPFRPGTVTFPGPMGLASDVTGYEPTTGGRGNIGIVTDKEAEFLMTGDARNMLADARSVPTQPIWHWDESTGKLIDIIAKPYTTAYSSPAQGTKLWLGPWPAKPAAAGAALRPSGPQTAHMMEICGIAALATGAPRYVRGVQARVIQGFIEDNAKVRIFGSVTCFDREMRGTAWLFRELFYCYWATVQAEEARTLPADCLPSTTFKKIIDNQASQFSTVIAKRAAFQTFAVATDNDPIAWWQVDMLCQVLGLYANKWPDTWGDIYIAFLASPMARINGDGKMQWPPASPTWYWANVHYTDATGKKQPYPGYPALWTAWTQGQIAGTDASGNNGAISAAQVAALAADPTNGGAFIDPKWGEYYHWLFGALAYAVFNDRGALKGRISAAYPNLENAFTAYYGMQKKLGSIMAQCSIAAVPAAFAVGVTPPGSGRGATIKRERHE